MGSQLLLLSLEEAEIHGGKVWQSKAAYVVEATDQKCKQKEVTDIENHRGAQFLQHSFYSQVLKDIKVMNPSGNYEFIS